MSGSHLYTTCTLIRPQQVIPVLMNNYRDQCGKGCLSRFEILVFQSYMLGTLGNTVSHAICIRVRVDLLAGPGDPSLLVTSTFITGNLHLALACSLRIQNNSCAT